MKKIKTSVGYTAYQATAYETALLGGAGICDHCGEFADEGYLVPVLNHYMCPECFKDWEQRGRFYPEDLPVEQRTIAYYEAMIPVEGEGTA